MARVSSLELALDSSSAEDLCELVGLERRSANEEAIDIRLLGKIVS